MMQIIKIFLTPFVYLYILEFRIRNKLFGVDILFKYLPSDFSKHVFPVLMDIYWIKRGFIGLNKCLFPKGKIYSKRFDPSSPYFQSWIGAYLLQSFGNKSFKDDQEEIEYFASAAVEDQRVWLWTYGAKNCLTRLKLKTVKPIKFCKNNGYTTKIYYGEMESFIDSSKRNSHNHKLIKMLCLKAGEIYNKVDLSDNLLFEGEKLATKSKITLCGFYSITKISDKKFVLGYVCSSDTNFEKVKGELFKTIDSIEIKKF